MNALKPRNFFLWRRHGGSCGSTPRYSMAHYVHKLIYVQGGKAGRRAEQQLQVIIPSIFERGWHEQQTMLQCVAERFQCVDWRHLLTA